jgi:hypothetical protein
MSASREVFRVSPFRYDNQAGCMTITCMNEFAKKSPLEPTTDPGFVRSIAFAELTLQVRFLWQNCEDLKRTGAQGGQQQDPDIPKQNRKANAPQHHLQVERIPRESVGTASHDLCRRGPRIFALSTPTKENDRVETQAKNSDADDRTSYPIAPKTEELELEGTKTVQGDSD